MKLTFLSLLLLASFACSGPQDTSVETTPAPVLEPDRLLAELVAAGFEARQIGEFSSEPLGGLGLLLCLGSEEVRVYRFGNEESAAAAADRIDPDDPSNIGNAIVEWNGNPRFWQRGPMLVLYLGEDQANEGILVDLLGPPFARGGDSGRGLDLPGPCLA